MTSSWSTVRLLREPARDRLRQAELPAERGEQHLGALLLRQTRHVEGDRAVREDAGDQELLAVEQTP